MLMVVSMCISDPESIQLKTDLIYCKTRISMLETQLTHKDTEIKEQNILHEKEIAELKRQHDVGQYLKFSLTVDLEVH